MAITTLGFKITPLRIPNQCRCVLIEEGYRCITPADGEDLFCHSCRVSHGTPDHAPWELVIED